MQPTGGKTVEHWNPSQLNPVLRPDRTPCSRTGSQLHRVVWRASILMESLRRGLWRCKPAYEEDAAGSTRCQDNNEPTAPISNLSGPNEKAMQLKRIVEPHSPLEAQERKAANLVSWEHPILSRFSLYKHPSVGVVFGVRTTIQLWKNFFTGKE